MFKTEGAGVPPVFPGRLEGVKKPAADPGGCCPPAESAADHACCSPPDSAAPVSQGRRSGLGLPTASADAQALKDEARALYDGAIAALAGLTDPETDRMRARAGELGSEVAASLAGNAQEQAKKALEILAQLAAEARERAEEERKR